MPSQRLEILKKLVSQDPADRFARYGLAMEHAQEENLEEAVSEFEALLSLDSEYKAAYHQYGQVLEKLGRSEEAKEAYQRGIEVARRLGDTHLCDLLDVALRLLR